jgi:RNA polymerase sigma factor (sigma-70 family)
MEKGLRGFVGNREERNTPLEEVISAFGLQPATILRTADRIAHERGVPSISRTHLLRLRKGRTAATEEKILILVSAIREMTGVMLRAGELFALEPALAGAALPFRNYGDAVLPPVSSPGSRIAHFWRVLVSEHPTPSSDQAFETLYVEYGVLLRDMGVLGYGIPRDDAEALVHDCFIAYLERHTTIRHAKGWLSGTMRNSCRHYLRDRKREAPLGPEHDGTVDTAAHSSLDVWMRKLTLASVLARLGAKCRDSLRAYYLAGEAKQSMADRMATSANNVDQLLSTCRRRALELLRGLGGKK